MFALPGLILLPLAGLFLPDMRLGQLGQAVLGIPVGKGSIEDIDHVKLRDAGGHGPASEGGLIGGNVDVVIRQLRHRGRAEAGDGKNRLCR